MVLLSLFARNALIGDREAYHLYVFFMPAILLASMVLRHGGGILAVLLSAVLIKAFYIPPLWSGWVNDPDDAVAIAVFIGSGLVTAVMGSALHRILFRLAKANDQIAAAERQNALLLDELTHRFKNDLANLTAILRLHAKEVADPHARNELIIASERVNVLRRVHERLTGSPKDTLVNVGEFLMELCRDLRVTAIGMRPVTLRTDLDSLELPFEAAISLGLIVNELVQNAIKYAFPGDRRWHWCARSAARRQIRPWPARGCFIRSAVGRTHGS
jgi:signal transduction histidine kinase